MALRFDELVVAPTRPDRLPDPTDGSGAGAIAVEEVLPCRDDPGGVEPHLGHVGEHHAIGIAVELGPQGSDLGVGDDHQDRLVSFHARTDERDRAFEEPVGSFVQQCLVTEPGLGLALRGDHPVMPLRCGARAGTSELPRYPLTCHFMRGSGERATLVARRRYGISACSGGNAGAKRKPCTSSQPRVLRHSNCSEVSTPSAVTASPSSWAMRMVADTMASSSESWPRPITKLRSILMTRIGRLLSCMREAW